MTDLLGIGDAGAVRPATTTTDVSNPAAGDTWAQDCTLNTPGTGTGMAAKFFNRQIQQLRRVIRWSGIALNNADDDMLALAIQSNALASAIATNVANAYAVTLGPAPLTLMRGMDLTIAVPAANTGAATLNVNGMGAVAITRADLTPAQAGDLPLGAEVRLIFDATQWQIAGLTTVGSPARNVVSYLAAGTYSWTPPAGVTRVRAVVVGGGSGSAAGGGGFASAGGAGGGLADKLYCPVTPGVPVSLTVGAGGAAGTTTVLPGGGGASSFGAFCSATGGANNGALTLAAPVAGAVPGVGSSGDINLKGTWGTQPFSSINGAGYVGGFGGGSPMSGGVSGNNGVAAAGSSPGGGAGGVGAAITTGEPGADGGVLLFF